MQLGAGSAGVGRVGQGCSAELLTQPLDCSHIISGSAYLHQILVIIVHLAHRPLACSVSAPNEY